MDHMDHHLSRVSIRRADRCLVEGIAPRCDGIAADVFQSAVRIAVWLKFKEIVCFPIRQVVSIRRADRCLVEGLIIELVEQEDVSFNPPCGSLFG